MPEQFGDKRHEATPYRRQQAREQGQVARSQDLASAAVLVGSLLLIIYFGDSVVRFLEQLMQQQLGSVTIDDWKSADASAMLASITVGLARVLLPILGLVLVLAILSHVGQTGFLFLPQKVSLDWNHVNPLRGLQRIFSWSSVMRLLFGLSKTTLVLIVAVWCLWSDREQILSASSLSTASLAVFLAEFLLWTTLKIAVALLILALLDYGYQYWHHEHDLRMTDQELREEMKTLQGDPQILARRRSVQRQLVLNRLSTIVPTADFVVTNPTELAVAIQYEMETMAAPIVVAKGAGVLAQRIRRLALENSIPIIERKELARALYQQVDVNQPIPTDQYAAVAEILRYVYQLKGKTLPKAA
jgi:flagellar biosynthetic protein FlhB